MANKETSPTRAGQDAEASLKVFVGNLDYSTTEETLKQFFSQIGQVVTAELKTRRRRARRTAEDGDDTEAEPEIVSSGYGFISYATEQEAFAAVAKMNTAEIDGRSIHVELAKPVEELQNRRSRPRGRGRRGRGAARPSRETTSPKRALSEGAQHESSGEENNVTKGETSQRAPRSTRGRGRKRVPNKRTETSPEKRKEEPASPSDPQEPTKTTVYVSNIPFSLDTDGLAEQFRNLGFNVNKAYVATLRRGRAPPRSKGFGFVEFASEADQARAVKEVDGKEIEGRPVSVKVAMSKPEREYKEV